MKVISFLGIGQYKTTFYTWQNNEYETEFFAEAVAHLLKPEEMIVCVTPTVREGEKSRNWANLQKRFEAASIQYCGLEIPEGHSENELWAIFDALTGAVLEGEEVVFDLTNSFRSLPFLSFLAIAYLRIARNIKVKHVLYGAYDAKDQNNRSPVFDLTPFVALLDWTNATSRFLETGDGHSLSDLLKSGMPTGVQMGENLELRMLGQNMKYSAEAIQTVSLALQVTRPIEVMESSAHLSDTLMQALPLFAEKARPFAVLAEKVVGQYGQFGLEDAAESVNFNESLKRQLTMIEWYLSREQVVQAATLMREWVVSLLAYHFNVPMFDLKTGRELVEKSINNGVERRKINARPIDPGSLDERLEGLPQAELIYGLWSRMAELRNDIAHVGMRPNPKTASQLKQKISALLPQFEKLAADFLFSL